MLDLIDSATPVDLNAAGWGLFDAAVDWAINGGSSTYMPNPNQATAAAGAFKGNLLGKRGTSAKIQAISGSIQRISLSFAGQPVAVQVSGDPDPANNGLFHIYADHLGSSGSLSDSSGVYIPNSHAKYTPFGDWRTEPTATAGDRYYTNHKHNNLGNGADDLGLIYMNARFYLPGVGRFASADTIVPDPANPQAYNRYSYVNNNPMGYVDPSGRHGCGVSAWGRWCSAINQENTDALDVSDYTTVNRRHSYYNWVQDSLDTIGNGSKWFEAAAIVTELNGVGAVNTPGALTIPQSAQEFLRAGNEYLFSFNMSTARDLLNNGGLSYKFEDANGKIVSLSGLSGLELDLALVQLEQSHVQDFISGYAYENGWGATQSVTQAVSKLFSSEIAKIAGNDFINEIMAEFFGGGADFDFGNYDHRVLLGQELVKRLHEDD